jgi:hypothetical protein
MTAMLVAVHPDTLSVTKSVSVKVMPDDGLLTVGLTADVLLRLGLPGPGDQ